MATYNVESRYLGATIKSCSLTRDLYHGFFFEKKRKKNEKKAFLYLLDVPY